MLIQQVEFRFGLLAFSKIQLYSTSYRLKKVFFQGRA